MPELLLRKAGTSGRLSSVAYRLSSESTQAQDLFVSRIRWRSQSRARDVVHSSRLYTTAPRTERGASKHKAKIPPSLSRADRAFFGS